MEDETFNVEAMKEAHILLKQNQNFVRTPLIQLPTPPDSEKHGNQTIYLKCESLQFTGSFKYRGVVSQFHYLLQSSGHNENPPHLVTMSAGNYGKAFATMCASLGLKGTVLVPSTCSTSRVDMLKSLGVDVELHPSAELEKAVRWRVDEMGQKFLHPFDDKHLLLGYASVALELFEDLNEPGPDVLLVCCGGGGLLAAVSTCIRLTKRWPNCRIYGVEPENANTMWLSMKEGVAVRNGNAHSIARGLAPPYVGQQYCFPLCQRYIDGVILVSEQEIAEATLYLHQNASDSESSEYIGQVEPSGAAAFAAWLFGKVPHSTGKPEQTMSGKISRPKEVICILISGSNVDDEQIMMVHSLLQ